jgi:DNA-binding response OmpR family regulator
MNGVLLVHDEIEIVDSMRSYLGDEGFEVESVADTEQAIKLSLSGRYGLVILDFSLPEIDGLDVLRCIRAESSVPILIVTATKDDPNRILGQDGYDCLPRPLNPRER